MERWSLALAFTAFSSKKVAVHYVILTPTLLYAEHSGLLNAEVVACLHGMAIF